MGAIANQGKRNTVTEIKVKHKRESSLKSLYVEGPSDKSLIEWFLKNNEKTDLIVYDISTLDIPYSELEPFNLDDNKRSRVIVLLESVLDSKNIYGIIDKDFDFIEKKVFSYSNVNLFFTDYANMEMYCFNLKSLEKLFLGFPNSKPSNFTSFIKNLEDVLVELFLIRFIKSKEKKELTHLDPKKSLKLVNNKIEFDKSNYLTRLLSNNTTLINLFHTNIEDIKKNLPSDNRKIIHGHDFLFLFLFYVKKPEMLELVEKVKYTSLEIDDLRNEELFNKILAI